MSVLSFSSGLPSSWNILSDVSLDDNRSVKWHDGVKLSDNYQFPKALISIILQTITHLGWDYIALWSIWALLVRLKDDLEVRTISDMVRSSMLSTPLVLMSALNTHISSICPLDANDLPQWQCGLWVKHISMEAIHRQHAVAWKSMRYSRTQDQGLSHSALDYRLLKLML